MCRWLAYSGEPAPLEHLIVRPQHSLIDQSMKARMAAYPTNGDGIGVGWYGRTNEPGFYHSVLPAWNDKVIAVKAFTYFPSNTPPDALLYSKVMIFDRENGEPLGLVEGAVVTFWRTGGVSGLATRLLSREA